MPYDILVRNGTIFDGTGNEPVRLDIGITKGKIVKIGNLSKERANNEINAKNKYVSPGFIDITNTSDHYLSIFSNPSFENFLRQGVTSVILGQCGVSIAPILKGDLSLIENWSGSRNFNISWVNLKEFFKYLSKRNTGVNIGTLVGYLNLREYFADKVFRPLKNEEVASVAGSLAQNLEAGALGVSLGLGYFSGRAVGLKEIQTIIKKVGKLLRYLSVHLRDESSAFLPAVEEIIEIAKNNPNLEIEISHFKSVGRDYYKDFDVALEMIDQARLEGMKINFDFYPYSFTSQPLIEIFPDWVTVGSSEGFLKIIKDKNLLKKLLTDLKQKDSIYKGALVVSGSGVFIGKTIEEIAENRGISSEEAVIDIFRLSAIHPPYHKSLITRQAIIFSPSLLEENIKSAIANKWSMISSAGSSSDIFPKEYRLVHPRNFGVFPKFLKMACNEEKILSWQEAIYKITGLPATKLGLKNRGFIREGNWADIVIFDPENISDKSTIKNPYQIPVGINTVLVNGKIAVDGLRLNSDLGGKIIQG